MQVNAQTLNKWYKQAVSLQSDKKYHPAITYFEKVIKAVPNHFAAWNLLGYSYLKMKQKAKAYECFKEALKWCPEFFPAAVNLAELMLQDNHVVQAKELIIHFLKLHPQVAKLHYLHYTLAKKDLNKRETDLALANYIKYLSSEDTDNIERDRLNWQLLLDLELEEFLDNLESEKSALCHLHHNVQNWMKKQQSTQGFPSTVPNCLFYLAYYDTPAKELLQDIGTIYRKVFPQLTWTSPHCINTTMAPHRKPKIGVLSCYLDKFHAVSFSLAPLVKALNNDDQEIIYFRLASGGSSMHEVNYKETLGNIKCVDIPSSIEEARHIIAKHEVDILWYTDICMTPQTYLLAHARLAPIQCVSGGHPCTTGLDTIDYFFSSTLLEDKDCQERYTEKVIPLPTFPAIYEDFIHKDVPHNRAAFNLPEDKNLYFCAQMLFKVHPKMDTIFKGILEADPRAVILFSYANTPIAERLKQRLKQSLGDLSERCQFIPSVPQHQFFFLLKQVDVLLDTFPFSGGNTLMQSISMLVPTVTLVSQELRGSVGTALYRLMGIEECLACDLQDYIHKSITIAGDTAIRDQIAQKIRDNKYLVFDQNESILQAYQDAFAMLQQKLNETYLLEETARKYGTTD
ncbi:tetratricopeptide repeat protein [Candidatus Odyssella thessalonicensis]|uniref:O-linked N-acetylglucosamine transferase family protein n=1 Tax=Candidatus Odyssella thessalonicensis TaxID=84647 RepID=UPI000225C1C5|nr:tetratricopeptide repeat protein [Candidatus Odyssella thessalonicensis]